MAISTRLHGWIDYAAALSLGGFTLFGGLPRPSRRVAAVATALPACSFLLTDFEGGLVGRISVPRHLSFDKAEGLLLFGTAVAMRRQPAAARVLLAFYGLAQFIMGSSTRDTAERMPGQGSGPIQRLLGSA